ncbi:MAG TPA: hypothetical protein VN632_08185 [Stellaceae bacterium]|nr:hypothetical protein [Stellaceae bacterium]
MRNWKQAGIEPSIDELLDDEVMVPIMRSAGLCQRDLRTLVSEAAERLASANDNDRGKDPSGRRPAR